MQKFIIPVLAPIWTLFILLLITSTPLSAQIQLNCPTSLAPVCVTDQSCVTDLWIYYPDVTTDCNEGGLTVTPGLDGVVFANDLIDSLLISNIPIGQHAITYDVSDNCGNSDNCTVLIEIVDCRAPAPVCINGLALELMPVDPPEDLDGDGDLDEGAQTVWATDFIVGTIGDCTPPVRYSVNRAGDQVSIDQEQLVVTCEDEGTLIVNIYAWDSANNPYSVQPDGTVGGPNYDFCETYILVQNNLGACEQVPVSGTMNTPNDTPIQGAFIGNRRSAVDGSYSTSFYVQSTFMLAPYFDSDFSNGIDDTDLQLLSDYLGNPSTLTDPYLILAADVDLNGVVDEDDLDMLGQLISGSLGSFPHNKSWRFIWDQYEFPDPNNPFLEPLPESFDLDNTEASYNFDFVGFKVGDLDGSANSILAPEHLPPARLAGFVRYDENQDCLEDDSEAGLANWVITAQNGSENYFTTSDQSGAYILTAPPGNYTVSLIPPSDIWAACENDLELLLSGDITAPDVQNWPVTANEACALLDVNLQMGLLRRCFSSFATISYHNYGSTSSNGVSIVLSLDDDVEFLSASVPFTIIDGQTISFQVGNLDAGQTGSITIELKPDCDLPLGTVACNGVAISGDNLCTDPDDTFSGLEIQGDCLDEEVLFQINNNGADMPGPRNYYVVEDHLIMFQGEFELDNGEQLTITRPAMGTTQRIQIEPNEGQPSSTAPSLSIEACGTDEEGNFSTGIVNSLPLYNFGSNQDRECLEVVGSYDPNDKMGFPLGVGPNQFIEANTPIDYRIRFQNTGTDTAFTVVIVDTLPATLNPASIRITGASHPYTWELNGTGVLRFVFDDILLPDSTTNEPASHGFVTFNIEQAQDLPDGTIIENRAGIYFDFNPPVITEYSFHTIGSDFLVGPNATISGRVQRPDGLFLSDTELELISSGTTTMSDQEGLYSFEPVLTREDYSVKAYKADLPEAGISISDLLIMTKHILQVESLTDPYRLLAADMNRSGAITTFDAILVQKMILGQYQETEEEPVWRFIPADFSFPVGVDPLSLSIPTQINKENLMGNTEANFYGIKMGDLNYSFTNLNTDEPIGARTLGLWPLQQEWVKVAGGHELRVYNGKTGQIEGLQLAWNFTSAANAHLLEHNLPNLRTSNFDFSQTQVRLVYTNPNAQISERGQLLFSVFIEDETDEQPIGQSIFNRLIDSNSPDEWEVALISLDDNPAQNQWQPFPIPAKHYLELAWPENYGEVKSIFLSDPQGKQLANWSANNRQLDLEGLAPGIYLLEVKTATDSYKKRIIIQ